MRTIDYSNEFKRQLRRLKRQANASKLVADLVEIIELLMRDEMLPPRCLDHALIGKWNGYRDCHVRPDLVLIYRKIGDTTLHLLRIGSHSELGL